MPQYIQFRCQYWCYCNSLICSLDGQSMGLGVGFYFRWSNWSYLVVLLVSYLRLTGRKLKAGILSRLSTIISIVIWMRKLMKKEMVIGLPGQNF